MPLDAAEREREGGGWLLTGMKETKKEERAFFHQASFDLCVLDACDGRCGKDCSLWNLEFLL